MKLNPEAELTELLMVLDAAVSSTIEVIIGVFGSKLTFLTKYYWVCSIEMEPEEAIPVHHSFIPNEWISIVNQLVIGVGKTERLCL